MNKILVCPIAFNENVKLKNAIERFLNSTTYGVASYMIMDDGSTDGTTKMIQSYAHRGITTLKHDQRQGVGAAIRTAIRFAIEQGYEIIVIMAGNDKDDPNEIPLLIDPIIEEGYDIVQGSRYLTGKRTGGDMPFYRKVATRLHPLILSFFVGRKVTDSSNGFRAIKLSIFQDQRINLDQSWLEKYELEPYILFKTISLGYRFKEAPVTKIYPSKKLGYTKMRPLIGWWSILRPLFFLGLRIKK